MTYNDHIFTTIFSLEEVLRMVTKELFEGLDLQTSVGALTKLQV